MKYLILLGGLISASFTYSAPMSEELSICYTFKSDKLVKKSSCVVNSGYGAGGSYVAIEQGTLTYNIETEITHNERTDEYEESEPILNDLPAKFYARDLFYKKIEDQSLITDDSLSCYETKNKKIDICYK
ncbi:hypothetical protein ABTH99_17340 [Acinetobacter baumannii]|uniref:hypothetical protein n=1 Tax=Acinetobacter baumannii TaxID=470 RepID=UPI0024B7A4EA|nr:hypothetical protein [Acinetobacter baumannii]MDI9741823.1 hypothetical protein [Acinetobacter baumannii]